MSGGKSGSITPGIPGAAAVAWRSFGYRTVPANALIPILVVVVTSAGSNSLLVYQKQTNDPVDFRIANSASFDSLFAPGSLASAFVVTGVTQAVNASFFSKPLPRTLAGVTLRFGGSLIFNSLTGNWDYSPTGSMEAPLHFVGPSQINFQIPPGLSADVVPVQLTKPDGSTLLSRVNIAAAAPGIFTLLMNGRGQGAVLNQDNSLNGNPETFLGPRPAARGSVIQIFATGAGSTNPVLAAGEPAPASGSPLVLTVAQPAVTIGGKTARVLFSGLAPGFVGLWQINAEVPQDVTPGSAVPLQISAGGVASNTVTIAVQ